MTLQEFIQQTLCKTGVQSVAGVELTFGDGRKLTIHSDDHPALKQIVTDKPSVKAVQSAEGGRQ